MFRGEWDAKRNRHSHVGNLLGSNKSVMANKSLSRSLDTLLTVGGEWNVGTAGMPTVEGPFRLAVADDEDAGCGHGRASSYSSAVELK